MEDPGLLSAFIDSLVSRLFSLAEEKYNLHRGFHENVTFLTKELPMITSAIDGQLLGQEDHILHLSVQELRNIAHEMEDCKDHIMYDVSWDQQSWYCKYVKSGRKIKSRSQLGEEMQRLRCRLECLNNSASFVLPIHWIPGELIEPADPLVRCKGPISHSTNVQYLWPIAQEHSWTVIVTVL